MKKNTTSCVDWINIYAMCGRLSGGGRSNSLATTNNSTFMSYWSSHSCGGGQQRYNIFSTIYDNIRCITMHPGGFRNANAASPPCCVNMLEIVRLALVSQSQVRNSVSDAYALHEITVESLSRRQRAATLSTLSQFVWAATVEFKVHFHERRNI